MRTVRGSDGLFRGDPLLDSSRHDEIGRRATKHVEGEHDVVGGEGLAVAPGHAVAELERDLGEVGVVAEAFGLPGNDLVGDVVGVEQHLVDGVVKAVALVQQHAGVGAEVRRRRNLIVEVPSLADQRPVARYGLQVLSRCTDDRDQQGSSAKQPRNMRAKRDVP